MNHAVLINHRIAVRRERATQTDVGIEFAILIEVHDAQGIGPADFPARRFRCRRAAAAADVVFAAAVRTHQPHAHSGSNGEMDSLEQRAPGDRIAKSRPSAIRRLVWRSVAEKSIFAEAVRVLAFRSANSPINSCAVSMRAFDLVVRALGPRRSHSISVCTGFRGLPAACAARADILPWLPGTCCSFR